MMANNCMTEDDFWLDLAAAADSGMDEQEFLEYLECRAHERAIELLGDFTDPEWR